MELCLILSIPSTDKTSMSQQVFGKFILLQSLSEDEMSEEFICQRLPAKSGQKINSGSKFRLQRFRPNLSVDKTFKLAFEAEGHKAISLTHPNINSLLESGREAGQAYLLTNYTDSYNLETVNQKLISMGAMFPPEVVLYLGQQIALGLAHAHSKDCRHWGISPSSIEISKEGQIQTIHWGLYPALAAVSQKLHPYAHGPWAYLSPEFLKEDKPDSRADLFSVGVLLWELITGRPYSGAGSREEAINSFFSRDTENPSSINQECPKDIDEVILGLLCSERQNRIQRADDLSRELGRLLFQLYPKFESSLLKQQMQELFFEPEKKVSPSSHEKTQANLQLELAPSSPITETPDSTGFNAVSGARPLSPEARRKTATETTPATGAQIRASDSRRRMNAQEEINSSYGKRGGISVFGFAKLALTLIILGVGGHFLWTKQNGSPDLRLFPGKVLSFARTPSSQEKLSTQVTIEANAVGFTILLDNEPVVFSENTIELPRNKPLRLTFKRAGFETQIIERTFKNPKEEMRVQFVQETPKGFLTFVTEPAASLTISQAGKTLFEGESPLEGLPLPVGVYQVLIENQVVGYRKEFNIKIEESLTTKFQTQLR
jgi:eukaryotic-like serine/threonine-protein kinase